MKVIVRYTKEVPVPLGGIFLKQVTEETLRRVPFPTLWEKTVVSLNAVAVSEEKIRELNRTYRGKDRSTDILSFGEYVDRRTLEEDVEPEIFLGEIFFCYDYIVAGAREDGVTVEHETIYVFSHGVLHLLGYNHEKEMFTLQDKVTESLMKQYQTQD